MTDLYQSVLSKAFIHLKQIRRSGKSKRKKKETSKEHTKSCVSFYTNINGFKSKADSLKQLIIEHNVDSISWF